MKLRAPSIPLITTDPYFTVWSPCEVINYETTQHWTGKNNSIIGTAIIDGEKFTFLGYNRDYSKMDQVSLDIDALSTTVVMQTEKITLDIKFTTPLIPDDYRLLTRPVTYMAVSYSSRDGKAHDVKLDVSISEELCLDAPYDKDVTIEEVSTPTGLKGVKIGNEEQKILNRSGDDICIDWGYAYLLSENRNTETYEDSYEGKTFVHTTAEIAESERHLYFFAYDDIASIEYFGKHLKSYWNKDGQTILEAIDEAYDEYDNLLPKCNEFSDRLIQDATEAGGEKYAEILTLAYRHVIAAHKLVLDESGEILFISKECFSNGCAATVDVSYPSTPMFLLYNPELVKGMMRPVYKYAQSDAWEFDFAPHDVGQYPLLNGQVYAENRREYQMPVEECGNMLIMETNVAIATGSADFARLHIDSLEEWSNYLIKYGTDPEHQLCTDDFAGHLAHNCNLSLKAIMGLQGMSILMKMMGNAEKATYYRSEAEKMAEAWMKTAINSDGSSKLAFDRPDTFSMKYNMVWDRVWKTGLFSQEFMDNELSHNKKHFNKYGLPLDTRADYTKSDWLVWVASMASEKSVFEEFVAPLWKAYNESSSRVALTDWYDTKSGKMVSFKHRSVQGGLFMRVLMNKWRND